MAYSSVQLFGRNRIRNRNGPKQSWSESNAENMSSDDEHSSSVERKKGGENDNDNKKKIRVFCDGCFDLVHFGHANSLRQAKQMGDVLVVGVHNDADISHYKGPPVFTEEERYEMVRAIKWVDEVVEGSTYWPSDKTLTENNCDFATHGGLRYINDRFAADDLSITKDGSDPYQVLKDQKLLKIYKRTKGVSTTDVVGRMLLLTKVHHTTTVSDKIVYVNGDWDLLHPGHLEFLKKAREHGDYLIVGIYGDQTVNSKKGGNYPIMNLYERTLSLLACRYVSDVHIDAPYTVDENVINQFNVSVVCHGNTEIIPNSEGLNPYQVAIDQDKFLRITTKNSLTTGDIVERIIRNRLEYNQRNKKKEKREAVAGEEEKMGLKSIS